MWYKVDGERYETAEAIRAAIENEEIETDFDAEDELNDMYGETEVCGMIYLAGSVLKEVDPIAYREAELSVFDDALTTLVEDIENMDEGDEFGFYGIWIECVNDEESDDEEA